MAGAAFPYGCMPRQRRGPVIPRAAGRRKVVRMNQTTIMKATLGRLPRYLQYLLSPEMAGRETVSATTIARALGLGEVQVRKDLCAVIGTGKPKIGYQTPEVIGRLQRVLKRDACDRAVIAGAGRLGRALMGYEGFAEYGQQIVAAFDTDRTKIGTVCDGVPIYAMDRLEDFCREGGIRTGIITVPAGQAQQICDRMVQSGVTAIWNFAPETLEAPSHVALQQENLALSLAYLNLRTQEEKRPEPVLEPGGHCHAV